MNLKLVTHWLLTFAILFVSSVQAQAAGPIKVHAECALRYSIVNCEDFKNSFFREYEKLIERTESVTDVGLLVELRDENLGNNQIRYSFSWESNLSQTRGSPIIVPLILTDGLDSLGTLTVLTTNAGKGLALYLKMESKMIGDDGTMVVVYRGSEDDSKPKKKTWFDRLENSPVYFGLSGSGNASKNGTGASRSSNGYFSGDTELSYLKDRYKLKLTGRVSLNSVKTPDGSGGQLSGTVSQNSYSAVAVYSLSQKWSVAVINTTWSDPASSIENKSRTQLGIEWTLVPFRTTENKELAFRIGNDLNYLTLSQPNDLDHLREKYMGAFAQIYFYWVTNENRITLDATADVRHNYKYPERYQLNLTGSLRYQITKALAVNGMLQYNFNPFSMTYPKEPDYSNPLQSQFLGGSSGSSFFYQVGVDLRLGNSWKKMRDRRWE